MSKSKEKCSNCRFAAGYDDDSIYCRRYPPTVVPPENQGDEIVWMFPIIMRELWCGEWKKP